jgi:hypothetical protein
LYCLIIRGLFGSGPRLQLGGAEGDAEAPNEIISFGAFSVGLRTIVNRIALDDKKVS